MCIVHHLIAFAFLFQTSYKLPHNFANNGKCVIQELRHHQVNKKLPFKVTEAGQNISATCNKDQSAENS